MSEIIFALKRNSLVGPAAPCLLRLCIVYVALNIFTPDTRFLYYGLSFLQRVCVNHSHLLG